MIDKYKLQKEAIERQLNELIEESEQLKYEKENFNDLDDLLGKLGSKLKTSCLKAKETSVVVLQLRKEEEMINESLKQLDLEEEVERYKVILNGFREEETNYEYLNTVVEALSKVPNDSVKEKLLGRLKGMFTLKTENYNSYFRLLYSLSPTEAVLLFTLELLQTIRVQIINESASLTRVYEIYADYLELYLIKNIIKSNCLADLQVEEHSFNYLFEKMEQEALNQLLKHVEIFKEDKQMDRLLLNLSTSNLKDVAIILEEISSISQRVYLFKRFLTIKQRQLCSTFKHTNISVPSEANLIRKLREFLSQYYLPLETHFLQESIRKSISSMPQLSTDVIEDCFYLFKIIIKRGLTTEDFDCVLVLLNLLLKVLEMDFYKNGILKQFISNSSIFCLFVNCLEISAHYLSQLLTEYEPSLKALAENMSFSANFTTSSTSYLMKLEGCLSPLKDFKLFQQELEQYLNSFYNQQIRPLIKQKISEFSTTASNSYILNESEFSKLSDYVIENRVIMNGVSDTFYKFINGIDEIIKRQLSNKEVKLSEGNNERIVELICSNLCKDWEKIVMLQRVNVLGALKLDKEIRTFCSYFSSMVGNSSVVKECFQRLLDISYLLNIDSIDEICGYDADGLTRGFDETLFERMKINRKEARKVLLMRFTEVELDAARIQ